VAYAGATLLNRADLPPPDLGSNETIAIHAGKGWDKNGHAWLRLNAISLGIPLCPNQDQHHRNRIMAVCRVAGIFIPPEVKRPGPPPNPWFRPPPGGCAWHLVDVARLPDAVECRGTGSLFTVPSGVEGAVDVSLSRRRECRSCSRARTQRHGPPRCEIADDPTLHTAGGCDGWRPR
jgi:hypothetical protein